MNNDNISLINLTGNDIRIILPFDEKLIPKSNWQAKCKVERRKEIEINDVPIMRSVKGDPVGVPEPKFNTYYIVSKIVAEKLKEAGRVNDILVPDEIVRSNSGQIIGCKSLTFA